MTTVKGIGETMRKLISAIAIVGISLGFASTVTSEQSPGPPAAWARGYAGVWIDDTGQGAVQIEPCGANLCGRIVWLHAPHDPAGNPVKDELNPEPAARSRLICGLQVIGDLKRQTDSRWDGGWIYDPKVGKYYDVALRLRSSDQLEVTGYLGVKLLSETFTWKRAPEHLPSCMPANRNNRAAN